MMHLNTPHIVLWLLPTLLVSTAIAEPETDNRPTLLLLMGTADLPAFEHAFQTELALNLETHRLTVIPFSFASSSQSRRIADIRKTALTHHAELVVWLEQSGDDLISLHMISAVPGRSTLRSIEARAGATDSADLVISTRELLNEIVFEAEEKGTSATSPSPAEIAEPTQHPGKWFIGAGVDASGGIAGQSGPAYSLLGVDLSAIYLLVNGMTLQVSISLFTSPEDSVFDGSFRTLGLRPTIGVGYRIGTDAVSVAPGLLAQTPWQLAKVNFDNDFGEKKYTWWSLRLMLAVDACLRMTQNTFLSLRPGLGVSFLSAVLVRESDGQNLYSSPWLDWNIRLAVIINLPR